MPSLVTFEHNGTFYSNNRIERLKRTIETLTSSFPVDTKSTIVVISPPSVRRLWQHAEHVLKTGRNFIYLEPSKFGEFAQTIDERVIFVVDEVYPEQRPRLLAELKTLDMSFGHRMFLTSMSPASNNGAAVVSNLIRNPKNG